MMKQQIINEFKYDVFSGLSKKKKEIPSRYFYDEEGSVLFNKITQHPDYYLTTTEFEILNKNVAKVSALMGNHHFNLIELGPGDGSKTSLFIKQFLRDKHCFDYIPIDISQGYLENLSKRFLENFPGLALHPIFSDYLDGLTKLNNVNKRRNVVLFLGSSIGNFTQPLLKNFLKHLRQHLNHNDLILIGFDLRKNIDTLMKAYDDNLGITKEFNYNLLRRLNKELGANFNTNQFQHYATYNVYRGSMESYLVSLENQSISIDLLEKSFIFDKYEPLLVEHSFKFNLPQILKLANVHGFNLVENFVSDNQYFVNSLWRVDKLKKI